MQEKRAPVFVVATANDVTQLPPEFLRKRRFDETFFVDLPNHAEREAIWSIQIGRYGRKPESYDLASLAKASDGMTGAEIEQTFIDALFAAFSDGNEPGMLTISQCLTETVPLSRLMAEQIDAQPNRKENRHGTISAEYQYGSFLKVVGDRASPVGVKSLSHRGS